MSDEWNWNDGQPSLGENKKQEPVREKNEDVLQNRPGEKIPEEAEEAKSVEEAMKAETAAKPMRADEMAAAEEPVGADEMAAAEEPVGAGKAAAAKAESAGAGKAAAAKAESAGAGKAAATKAESAGAGEASQEAVPRETYHWVNPEYQKRQQGTADAGSNTYETNSYRENVKGTPNQGAERNTYGGNYENAGMHMQDGNHTNTARESQSTDQRNRQPGYRGGAYHSDWRNQSQGQTGRNPNTSGQAWGTSGHSQGTSGHEQQNQANWKGEPLTGQRHYGTYQFAPEPSKKSPKEKKPMGTGKKFLVTVGLAVVFGLVAGGVMFGVNALGNHLVGQEEISEKQVQIPSTETPAPTEVPSQAVSSPASGEFTVSEVANACMPSVVSITNASVKTVKDFFGGVQEYPIESSGSGIIVGQNDKELLIATNNHVVEGADTITVAFNDDAIYEAQVKGNAQDSDLAVIAVKLQDMTDETLNSIKIVTLGDSENLQIGEQVVAIGNALGYGQSVTSGWVSAVNREVTDEEGNTTGALIQTDAAINPGNSGGALLNMRGELVGINSAKASATEVEGMGYAIPIATAQPILDELMNRETRFKVDEDKAAYIGVTCLNVESSSAQMYGIPLGAFVDSVEEGGPAAAAGIQKGDVIVKFDGLTVSGSTDLVSKLEYYEVGETVEVVISRAENGEYKEQTVTVTLGRRKDMKQTDPRQNR